MSITTLDNITGSARLREAGIILQTTRPTDRDAIEVTMHSAAIAMFGLSGMDLMQPLAEVERMVQRGLAGAATAFRERLLGQVAILDELLGNEDRP